MIYYGIFFHLHVHDSLIVLVDKYIKNPVGVVRSIDSSWLGKDLENILKFHRIPYKVIHGNVCLFEENLKAAVSANVFTGFDEIWLFSNSFPFESLEQIPGATSDGQDFSQKLDPEILKVFYETGCIVLLADGCGLNYLTADPVIERELKKL